MLDVNNNMAFEITYIETEFFPSLSNVNDALAQFGLSNGHLKSLLSQFVCNVPVASYQGYQIGLARELPRFISHELTRANHLSELDRRYSITLNEKADLAIGYKDVKDRIFFEIEFRPNVEKDLVKFQIGYNAKRLALAVLILTTDRNSINSQYRTMPEFGKHKKIIKELSPKYPLLLFGFTGKHAKDTELKE